MSNSIFISYRRGDTRWVAAALRNYMSRYLSDVKIFLDVTSIELGVDFEESLCEALSESSVQLVLIGEKWLTSSDEKGRSRLDAKDDWVRREIEIALRTNIRVIPILVDGASMPTVNVLPKSLKPLSLKQCYSIRYEDHHGSIIRLIESVAQIINVLPVLSEQYDPLKNPLAQSATSVMEIFEEESIDNKTLTILADDQLGKGGIGIAKAIYEFVAQRERNKLGGEPPNIDECRAIYNIGNSNLLFGEFLRAIGNFKSILSWIERERDESYPLYIRTQAAIARAFLELHRIDDAKSILPSTRGLLFKDQSLTAIDLWISFLEGRPDDVKQYLLELDEEKKIHTPTPEFARSLALLQLNIQNGNVPTMQTERKKAWFDK